jgi:hypothetical protein
MQDVVGSGREGQTRVLPRVPSSPSDRLHRLARLVERLGVAGRTDPEQIVLGKLAIAGEMRRLAREIGQ